MNEHLGRILNGLDATAALIAGGVLAHVIPTITGILAIGWYVVRFYEYFKNKRIIDRVID